VGQWQVLQLPDVQPLHDEPELGVNFSPLLEANTLIIRSVSSPAHLGQGATSEEEKTSLSYSSPHTLHRNS
jgi:hypothetical protein